MDRSLQLEALISSLYQLFEVLGHDPSCQWRRHFENCLHQARELKSKGFTQASLNELSGSVRSVYGGMGSFNDYAPVRSANGGSFRVIRGMENFDLYAGQVHERALSLMVVASG